MYLPHGEGFGVQKLAVPYPHSRYSTFSVACSYWVLRARETAVSRFACQSIAARYPRANENLVDGDYFGATRTPFQMSDGLRQDMR